MNATGYIINAILVLLVLRQIRESRLDLISLVLPVALVAGAAAYYLRAVPAAGNYIALDLTLAATGARPSAEVSAAAISPWVMDAGPVKV